MATANTEQHQGDKFRFPDEAPPDVDVTAEAPEVEVEIVDDTPLKDRGRKKLEKDVPDPTDEELDAYTHGVRQRIKELTHARHDERREKERLAREREEFERATAALLLENRQLKERFSAGAEAFGKVQNEAAEAALAQAKAKLKKAHEEFDTDAIADAQAELSEAVMRVQQAKNFRAPPVQQETDDVQPRQAQQPVAPDQRTLNWQAENQWFGQPGFEEYTSYALGLHQRLVASGIQASSDEYFAQINARMKRTFPELFPDDDGADPPTPQKKPPQVVAPATRQPAVAAGKVRLTQSQLAIAKRLGLTPQQYAAEVLKLQKGE
jgi:hypothetical protein